MNEKILNIIYKKLCDGFKINFVPRNQFETEISQISNKALELLTTLTKEYKELKYSEDKEKNSQIIKVSKDEYIINEFNSRYNRYNSIKFDYRDLEKLKSSKGDEYQTSLNDYNDYFEKDDIDIVIPLLEFIEKYLSENFPKAFEVENNETKSLEDLFWEFFAKKYFEKDYTGNYKIKNTQEILNSPENSIKEFSVNYLSNKFIKLLDIAEKNLIDETISGFDTIIVNVGTRHYESGRSGWATNSYKVLNNFIEYSFINSSKDEKRVEGEFINIFVHQKKHLIKINISLEEVERTPYIIYRDCEKISLKNECEIVIVKHHGNETIVFDSRKEALAFQAKLIEIREGMGRSR